MRYYIDDTLPVNMQKLVRYNNGIWEMWGSKDKKWFLYEEASKIMVGYDEWKWFDLITEKQAIEIIRELAIKFM